MPTGGFHERPFDEGTQTKLQLFQLYAREWLPVFLSRPDSPWKEIHLFDFFAGPGADSEGTLGSPLRLVAELAQVQGLRGWGEIAVGAHFFDEDRANVARLRERAEAYLSRVPKVELEIEALPFQSSFPRCRLLLSKKNAAKLVFIDQYGVEHVTEEVFRELVAFPTCDMLFFISSSTLHRFHEHPAIKQRIRRPNDYYHVHRAVTDYYRSLLPAGIRYFLGRFSIKKGPNIYGVIFGSSHPLGMDKFLRVAWQADATNGEADFDINRDDCGPLLSDLLPPTKITAFEAELMSGLESGSVRNEAEIIDICFRHGVRRQHAQPVLKQLRSSGTIECDFRVPDIDRLKDPRPIRLRSKL